MVYPKLILPNFCNAEVVVNITDGYDDEGNPKVINILELKCNYTETVKNIRTDEGYKKQSIGRFLFDGNVYSQEAYTGFIVFNDTEREIISVFKGRNPDTTVNYTEIEVI